MNTRTRRALAFLIVGASLLSLVACNDRGSSAAADRRYIAELRAGLENIDRAAPYHRHLEDLLPNRRYQIGAEKEFVLSERVVVGEFVGGAPGKGFRGTGATLGFHDKSAAWRTMHLKFRVDEDLAGDGPNPVTVGLGVDTDWERARDGMMSLGRSVLFLSPSPVYAYDPSLLAIVEDGAMIATIDSDSRLALPLIREERASQLLERTSTVAELRAEAHHPARTVPLERFEGHARPVS